MTMKKMMVAGMIVMASFSLTACNKTDRTTASEGKKDDKVVVDRDSVPVEYEVTETTVEYDTTTNTKNVDVDKNKQHDTNKDKNKDRNH